MKYIVYQTTNLVNGKIYIGIHQTLDPMMFDGYLGSGVVLRQAIQKHGMENFVRTTLFVFDSVDEAKAKEKELVDIEFCRDPNTYNLSEGGGGGNTLAGAAPSRRLEATARSRQTRIQNGTNILSPERKAKYAANLLSVRIQPDNKNRKHTAESKARMSAANKMRGKIWVTDGSVNLSVNPDCIPDGFQRGRCKNYQRFKEHTELSKQQISASLTGYICYTDGKINKKIKADQLPPPGFRLGMTQKEKGNWFTNGIQDIKVKTSQNPPTGFWRGRSSPYKGPHMTDISAAFSALANIAGGKIKDGAFVKTTTTTVTKTKKQHNVQKFYCIKVPGSAFIQRQRGYVSVTGNCHVDGMTWLFRQFIKENRELWNDSLKSELYSIAEKMVELEDNFIDLAFGEYSMEGLTAPEVKQYIRYIADRRLIALGLKGIFKVKQNPLPWVEEMLAAPEHASFFETKATEYSKGNMQGQWSDVWK